MNLVTIKESHYSADLLVIKSKLESEGIKCFIKDELTAEILSHLPALSAKLQVDAKDIPMVKQILGDRDDLDIDTIIHCPECNSVKLEIKLSTAEKLSFFVDMLKSLNVFRNNYKDSDKKKSFTYLCLNCKNKFRL